MRPPAPAASWLRAFHPPAPTTETGERRRRLICFPYAGGAAGFYFPLSAALAPAVDVQAVQCPGRQDRIDEPPVEDLTVLAAEIARRVVAGSGPAPVLFGHSMGALLAYETALRMESAHGITAARLIVSGMTPPGRTRSLRLGDDDEVLAELARERDIDPALLHGPELRTLILPALRGDHRALRAYRPGAHSTVSCPITVFTGADDPLVDPDTATGWSRHTRRSCRHRVFPGGHFYLDDFPPPVTAAVKAETFLA